MEFSIFYDGRDRIKYLKRVSSREAIYLVLPRTVQSRSVFSSIQSRLTCDLDFSHFNKVLMFFINGYIIING